MEPRSDERATLRRGLGVTAGVTAAEAEALALRAHGLGFHSLWSNDEPDHPGLETLARFAASGAPIELGVGVLPLDRNPPERIARDVERLKLDPARLWVGIGSGPLRPPVAVVERSVAQLRTLLPPETRIVIAAMRPRLCRLGGELADGVLLNWMPPAEAARARAWVREGADAAGRPAPPVASYVRVAVGPGAAERVRAEEGVYREINEGHRKHFAALDVPLGSVGVAGTDADAVQRGLQPYHEALDLPIARALPAPGDGGLLAVAAAAAPPAPAG